MSENTEEKKIPQDEVVVTQKTETVTTEKKEDAPEDQNFVAFREARKRDREKRRQEQEARAAADQRYKEKEAEAAALKAAMDALLAKGQQQGSYFDQPDESEEDRIEKKVQEALTKREAQAQREREQREHQEYPQRLQQNYSDFNQAISSENLDYLEYHYPEVAGPLSRLPDGYQKWQDIYKAVKKFVPNSLTSRKEAQKADNNFGKPKSMSSMGATQNAESMGGNRLTDDRKADNWARMQKALKGLS
jgi:hypothetical protein